MRIDRLLLNPVINIPENTKPDTLYSVAILACPQGAIPGSPDYGFSLIGKSLRPIPATLNTARSALLRNGIRGARVRENSGRLEINEEVSLII